MTKGQRTRRHIVDVSLQLFSVKGYYHTSIADILDASGLTKGGLYGHFRSKEEIWGAAYQRSVEIWRSIVFQGVRGIENPRDRVVRVIENDLLNYVGGETFAGGCFFFNMLVELTGQAEDLSRRVLDGFERFSRLLATWLEEAGRTSGLRGGLDPGETAGFIVTALNGAAALYSATRSPQLLHQTVRQLRLHLDAPEDGVPWPADRNPET